MNAPLHSPFGGSVAPRVLRCPASVGLAQKVPAHLRKSSIYAERGTALHVAATLLFERERTFDNLVGETIGDYVITRSDVEDALRPAVNYVDALLDTPGAEFYLERPIVFPTIPNAYGTADILVRIGPTVHIIDLKFGAGTRVLALYPDGDEDVVNAQLLFYAAAARYSLRQFFADVENVVLTILQPVTTEPDAEMVSSVTVTHAELDAFIAIYRAACAEAHGAAPRLERGDHCRFCPARPICPEHTKPLLDLAQFTAPTPLPYGGAFAEPPAKEAYFQVLADGLALLDAVKDIRIALHDQAKRALEQGDSVPGYRLSAGRAVRHWCDKTAAISALVNLGLARDDIIAETIRSPKQIELRAKARGLKVPTELIVSQRSGTSLVRSENVHVPVLGRGELARSFSEALEAFQEGRKQ